MAATAGVARFCNQGTKERERATNTPGTIHCWLLQPATRQKLERKKGNLPRAL